MNTEKETPEIETNEAATNGESAAPATETAEEKLARLESEANSFRDKWIRAEADLQNYKKRSDQERDELRRFAGGALIINLLPIVDDFERAFKSLDISLSGMTWFDGIQLIYRKLLVLLENAGVKPIQSEGQPFDPKVHEAVAHVPGEEGKVVAEVQRGYMLHDRVLRPAMVAVGNGEGANNSNEGDPGS
jgi:molecular chaperone GrpE